MWVEKINDLVSGSRGFPNGYKPVLDPEIPIELPSDFIELGRIFGHGTFSCATGVQLFNPFLRNFWSFVMDDIKSWRSYCVGVDYHDLPFYPETGGVLPFGSLDNGYTMGWVVEGIPDNWKVVLFQDLGEENDPFFSSLATGEYFFRLLSGQEGTGLYPDGYIEENQREMEYLDIWRNQTEYEIHSSDNDNL